MTTKYQHEKHYREHGKSLSSSDNDNFKQKAKNDCLAWESWELDILKDESISIADRARKLSRTYKACYTMLHKHIIGKLPLPIKKIRTRAQKDFDKMIE